MTTLIIQTIELDVFLSVTDCRRWHVPVIKVVRMELQNPIPNSIRKRFVVEHSDVDLANSLLQLEYAVVPLFVQFSL